MKKTTIFISYKREDKRIAKKLFTLLQEDGFTVWWDQKIKAGESFVSKIHEQAEKCDVLIALYSLKALQSKYIEAEATYAFEHNKLIPIIIENIELPIPFRTTQYINFIHWDEKRNETYDQLLEAIKNISSVHHNNPPKNKLKLSEKEISSPEISKLLEEDIPDKNKEGQFWETTIRIDTKKAYKQYLKLFPNGQFVQDAQQAIQKIALKRQIMLIIFFIFLIAGTIFLKKNLLKTTKHNTVTQITTVTPPSSSKSTENNSSVARISPSDSYHPCTNNDIQSCQKLVKQCKKEPSECPQIKQTYQSACDLNIGTACTELGFIYRDGKYNTPKNIEDATKYYQKACNHQDSKGCTALGYMYEKKFKTSNSIQDIQRSIKLYTLACTNDNGWGCNNLAHLYDQGIGVTKNSHRAIDLYQQACDLNNSWGCVNLGAAYSYGKGGLSKNKSKAAKLYKKSCLLSNSLGCYNLAIFYTKGKGVALDQTKAIEFYQKACDYGHQKACKRLKKIKG